MASDSRRLKKYKELSPSLHQWNSMYKVAESESTSWTAENQWCCLSLNACIQKIYSLFQYILISTLWWMVLLMYPDVGKIFKMTPCIL